jgi:hypothetical protein
MPMNRRSSKKKQKPKVPARVPSTGSGQAAGDLPKSTPPSPRDRGGRVALAVAVLGLVVAVVAMSTDVSNWLSRSPPDIRYTLKDQPSNALEFAPQAQVERQGDHVVETVTATVRFRLTNLSGTAGFVDRVELEPASVPISYSVAYIQKREIQKGEPEIIEAKVLLYMKQEILGPIEEKTYVFYVRAFDNLGRLIERYDDGRLGRVKITGKHKWERTIKPLAP